MKNKPEIKAGDILIFVDENGNEIFSAPVIKP